MIFLERDALARAVARDEGIEVPSLAGGFGNTPPVWRTRTVAIISALTGFLAGALLIRLY